MQVFEKVSLAGRIRLLSVAVLLILGLVFPAAARAEEKGPAPMPPDVERLLDLLARPDVQKWLADQRQAGDESAATDAETPDRGPVVDMFDRALAKVHAQTEKLTEATRAFPGAFKGLLGSVGDKFARLSPWKSLVVIALVTAVALFAQSLFRLAVDRLHDWTLTARVGSLRDRLTILATRLLLWLGDMVALTGGALLTIMALNIPAYARPVLLGYTLAILAILALWRLCTVVFALDARDPLIRQRLTIVPFSDDDALFWRRWGTMLAGFFLVGWTTVLLSGRYGMPPSERMLLAYILGTVLMVLALAVIWLRYRHRTAAGSPDEATSRLVRLILSFLAVILVWLLWLSGLTVTFWLVMVAIALYIAIRISDRTVDQLMRSPIEGEQLAPGDRLLAACLGRFMRVVLILLAIAFLARIWSVDLIAATSGATPMSRLAMGIFKAIFIILAADLLWQAFRTFIDIKLEEAEQREPHKDDSRVARLRTLLPIIRNVLLAALVIVAGLMSLASLGLDVAPLIAGAGVLGVAIGFGAQTVVKDIIAGMFYLFDDAFRVGEYIQSGSHKGTVEGFSLRSIRLRHQRGPIYTVPFGSLGAIENLSRDWVIDKNVINVTYDTDLDKVRKVIKKIDQELKEDPVFAPHIIETLKMQGVQSFGEYAIQIRIKLTTRPGEQFAIRRKAFAMIKKAFDENGIQFARPVVQVAGGSGDPKVAAAQAMLGNRLDEPE